MPLPPNKMITQVSEQSDIPRTSVIRVLASMSGIPRGQVSAMISQAIDELEQMDTFSQLESRVQVVDSVTAIVEVGHALTPRPMKDITPKDQ